MPWLLATCVIFSLHVFRYLLASSSSLLVLPTGRIRSSQPDVDRHLANMDLERGVESLLECRPSRGTPEPEPEPEPPPLAPHRKSPSA